MPNGRNINLGEELITGLSSVKTLTIPTGVVAAEALVTALSKSVRFIETAASASLMVTYFSGSVGQSQDGGV